MSTYQDVLNYADQRQAEGLFVKINMYGTDSGTRYDVFRQAEIEQFRAYVSQDEKKIPQYAEVRVLESEQPIKKHHTKAQKTFLISPMERIDLTSHVEEKPHPGYPERHHDLYPQETYSERDYLMEISRLQVANKELEVENRHLSNENERLRDKLMECKELMDEAEASTRGLNGLMDKADPNIIVESLTSLAGKFFDHSDKASRAEREARELRMQVIQLSQQLQDLQNMAYSQSYQQQQEYIAPTQQQTQHQTQTHAPGGGYSIEFDDPETPTQDGHTESTSQE